MSQSLTYYRDLLAVLLGKELKVRYKNTVLGYAWSVLHPLAHAVVFFLVFRVFMRIPIDNYALFLIAGLFPWQWFLNSVNASAGHFLLNRSLIKKVRFPRNMLVVASVLNDTTHFLLSLPVIVVFLAVSGKAPSSCWLWAVPLLTLVQFAVVYGFCVMIATWNLFFRDLERLVGILLMLWFYLTPVLYNVEMIPARYRPLIYANPLADLVICWRTVILEGYLPWKPAAVAVAAGLAIAALGHWVYRRMEWRFAEIV